MLSLFMIYSSMPRRLSVSVTMWISSWRECYCLPDIDDKPWNERGSFCTQQREINFVMHKNVFWPNWRGFIIVIWHVWCSLTWKHRRCNCNNWTWHRCSIINLIFLWWKSFQRCRCLKSWLVALLLPRRFHIFYTIERRKFILIEAITFQSIGCYWTAVYMLPATNEPFYGNRSMRWYTFFQPYACIAYEAVPVIDFMLHIDWL